MLKKCYLLLLAPLLLASCVTVTRVDPNAFLKDQSDKVQIPDSCRKYYETVIPKVAIAQISNNSTFDYAKNVQESVTGRSERTTAGAAGAVAVPGAAVAVWGENEKRNFQRDSQRTEREINAKLPESVEDGLINELVNMGGCKVYTRGELNKILQEQQFQQSGLVDDSSVVELGKMVGVKYMLTGSVTNVNLSYLVLKEAKQAAKQYLGGYGALLAIGMEAREGWHIDVELTLRILDVESGEIIFSKKLNGRELIGRVPYPGYDALVGGIKKASAKALQDARPELSKYFTVKGYLLQTKTSPDGTQKIGLVNVGSKMGIRPGSRFVCYSFEEIEDPMDGKTICDQQMIPLEMVATDQVQEDRSWVLLKGTSAQLSRVRAGQLVERGGVEGQDLMKRLGY